MKILKYIYNLRIFKNIRNFIRTKKLLGKSFGQLNRSSKEGLLLDKFILENNFQTILEIGTWNGLGSTKTIIDSLKKQNNTSAEFYSIESDRIAFNNATKNLKNENVRLLYGRIIEIDDLPKVEDINFEYFGFDPKNIEWFHQDIRRYKKTKNVLLSIPKTFDFILFDGGEFSTFAEFKLLWTKTKYFALDDTKSYKQFEVLKFIDQNIKKFSLVYDLPNFSIYKVSTDF